MADDTPGAALDAAAFEHLARGESDAAAEAFARAAEVHDDPASAALSAANRAGVLYGLGRVPEALEAFLAVIARRPAEPYAWLNAAACHAALGDGEAALAAWGRAAELGRAEGDARVEAMAWGGRAEHAGRQGLVDEAARCHEHAVSAWDASGDALQAAWARVALGDAHYLRGDRRGARRAYEAALPGIGPAPGVLANLGGVLYELGETEASRAVLEEALADPPTDAFLSTRLRGNRGLARLAAGDFDGAREDLAAAAEGYAAAGEWERVAHQLATLSNLARYQDRLDEAIDLQRRVMALERDHGFRVEEPGGLLYSAIEDRSLHVFQAEEGSEKVAAGGRQLPGPTASDAPGVRYAGRKDRPFLLFTPPMHGTFGPLFPRGATAVASYLQHHGIPVVVVPLSHDVDDFAGAESARETMRRVVHDAIEALEPRAIGVSVTFSYLYPRGLEIAAFAREAAPDTKIVIGGPHVTYWDVECLAEAPQIDVVVRGEGEWTALELLRTLERGGDLGQVAGITFRGPEGPVRTGRRPLGNVAELPEVDFGLLPDAFCRKMEISALTSRGCTFRCRYCHEFRYWGGVVREYTPERIVREMERVGRDYGNEMCGVDDSMLNMLTPYFFELVQRLGESPWLPERFGFLTRVDTLSADGLKAMREARIHSLSVGLESGSAKVLEAMNKGVTLQTALENLVLARDAGVALAAFFIVGHPGDDRVESGKTVDWIDRLFRERLACWIDASMFTPYPGTPFFTNPERHGVEILTMDWSLWRRANRPIAQLTSFPADEIYLSYLETLAVQSRWLGHGAQQRVAAE